MVHLTHILVFEYFKCINSDRSEEGQLNLANVRKFKPDKNKNYFSGEVFSPRNWKFISKATVQFYTLRY